MNPLEMQDEVIIATTELVGRTGGRELQVGYLHEGVPAAEAGWYAKVTYRGDRIIVEDHPGPVAAMQALAHRLLTGARCTHCRGLVALADDGAIAYVTDVDGAGGRFLDGTTWTADEATAATAAGQCRWRRIGPHWRRGCEDTHPTTPRPRPAGPNRADRRRAGRTGRR